jgi:DNA helicase-2/ATP-dependent DNA helicase PcrA
LREQVVLYRTHAQSRPFEELMLRSGIPYQIVGGFKFYERQEIKDTLAYLRLTQNPRDLVGLMRVVNVPARGVGEASFKIITQALQKYDYDFLRLSRNLAELELSAKAKAGANDFFSALLVARELPPERTLAELMHLLVTRTGFRDALLDGSEEGRNRWENVEELFNVAARYKKLPWAEGLSAFLEEVALMTDLDNFEEEGNKLTLMTLHSAKGLEFENVFLVGLEEGLLPHSRSLLSPSELQEEVRLAYVGITRAKRHLYLSYARQRQTYGEIKRSVPSRIIKAIPEELIERVE